MEKLLFTSESVTEGHPDKICDQISDAVLDALLEQDPMSRVACETAITTGLVLVMGEVTTTGYVDIQKIVRDTVREIGYTRGKFGFDADTCGVIVALDEQSTDIAMGVNKALEAKENRMSEEEIEAIGAGDQGMMFGYASNETEEYLPYPIYLAHKLSRRLTEVRKNGTLTYLRPDGKTPVSVEYDENGKPYRLDAVVLSTQHDEDVTQEQLGGASVHSTKSGVTHFTAQTEEEGLALIRELLSYIPQNNQEEAPLVECTDPIDRVEDALNEIIPDNPNKAYDMYEVIGAIVDDGKFLEVQKDYATNIIIGFARFNGQSVGIVANQPCRYAGVLDCNASRKGARFVRFCDAFNIPIVSLVDVPGFLPGTGQEYNAVILHGAKLLYAYGEATVPKVTVTLRKSYGGSHIVMSCKQLRGDINYAWPSAEIAVMGGSGAVAVLYAKEAKEKENPAEYLAEKEAEYTKLFANPYNAAKYGYIDDVIEPRNTRFRIIRALAQLQTKKLTNPAKKHGNIPL